MLRLESIFLHSSDGGGCNARGREQTRARRPSRLRAVGRYGHSESSAKLLIHLGLDFAHFSEYALISLKVVPDFDSTMRSLNSQIGELAGCFGKSLRLLPRIFPFSGDFHWRPGSILHCVRDAAVAFAIFSDPYRVRGDRRS